MICQQNSLSARTSSSPPHGLHHEPVGRLQTPESRAIAQAAHAEAHIGEDLAQWRGVWFFPETKPWEIRRISMEIHRKFLVKWMFLVVFMRKSWGNGIKQAILCEIIWIKLGDNGIFWPRNTKKY